MGLVIKTNCLTENVNENKKEMSFEDNAEMKAVNLDFLIETKDIKIENEAKKIEFCKILGTTPENLSANKKHRDEIRGKARDLEK